MWRKILLLLMVSILLIPIIYSEDTFVDQAVLENLEEGSKVPVLVEVQTKIEDLTFIQEFSATDIKLKHLSGNIYTAKINEQELEDLKSDPNILTIKEDEVFHILLSQSIPLINASIVQTRQFGTTNMTGLGQSICIIDSGIDTDHTAFTGRIIAQKCFCAFSDAGNGGCCSGGIAENSTSSEDDHGHGTHVAGIAAGASSAVTGVAPGANIIMIKVADSEGKALFSDITSAVNWCISNASLYNISVITISLGGGSFTAECDSSYSSLASEVTTAWNNNISVVAASGNTESLTTTMTSPACISKIISVSSSTKADAISGFKRNLLTDLLAPGTDITSSYIGGGTATQSGTSMAAPHVAGVIALMQQYATQVEGRNLTSSEVNLTLGSIGTIIDDTSGSGRTFIRVDARKSVANADTIFPLITNPNTTDTTILVYNNITFIVNITDVNRESIWIEGNWSGTTTNYTLINLIDNLQYNYTLTNSSFTASQVFQWRIHTNDTNNNENISSWFNISILAGAPRITLHNPSDNFLSNNLSVTFNMTPIDDVSVDFNCTLYINSISNQTKTTSNNTLTEFRVNLTEGTYLWNIACTDSNNLIGNSSLYTNILDSTVPLFNAESYATTELGNNLSYSINITDSNINYVNLSYQGRNYTLTNISTNFSTFIKTFQNGTNPFKVYALDLANNMNTTSGSFIIQDTILGPRIIDIIFPSIITRGATFNISSWIVNDEDISSALINYDGTNNSLYNNTAYNFTYNFTVSGCGSSSFKIYSIDKLNRAITNTSSYTITGCCGDGTCSNSESCSSCVSDCGACSTTSSGSSSSSSGSSGGGGGSPSTTSSSSPTQQAPEIEISAVPTKITKNIITANPENPIISTFDSANIPIIGILININKDVENVDLTVETLEKKPTEVEISEKTFYKFLSISTTNLESTSIQNAEITFFVPESWIIEENIAPESIVLLHDNNGWEELATTYLYFENKEYFYTASTKSFSYFAITGEKNNITESTDEQNIPPDNKNLLKYLIISIIIFILILILILFFVWYEKTKKHLNNPI